MSPIQRIKHVVDFSAGNVPAGTNTNVVLVKCLNSPDANTNPTDVAIGSNVNGIFLSVEVSCDQDVTTQIPNIYMIIMKNPGVVLPAIAPNDVGKSTNKRFVFHQEMVMLDGHAVGNPRTLFKGVIAIPKGYRRMADTDQIQIRILAPTVTHNICVQAHYKEFR